MSSFEPTAFEPTAFDAGFGGVITPDPVILVLTVPVPGVAFRVILEPAPIAAITTVPTSTVVVETTRARDSQIAVEVLEQGSARARVSQIAIEVLYIGLAHARESQIAVEVLHDPLQGTIFGADDPVWFGADGAKPET